MDASTAPEPDLPRPLAHSAFQNSLDLPVNAPSLKRLLRTSRSLLYFAKMSIKYPGPLISLIDDFAESVRKMLMLLAFRDGVNSASMMDFVGWVSKVLFRLGGCVGWEVRERG